MDLEAGGASKVPPSPAAAAAALLGLSPMVSPCQSPRGARQGAMGVEAGGGEAGAGGCLARARERVVAVFKQNLTPEQLALSLAIGFVGGVFPVPGLTSVAVLVAAMFVSFNMAAAQLVNIACTALELMLVPAFVYFGELLVRADEHVSLSPSALTDAVREDVWAALREYGFALGCALLGWLVFAVPGTYLLYKPLVPLVGVIMERINAKKE